MELPQLADLVRVRASLVLPRHLEVGGETLEGRVAEVRSLSSSLLLNTAPVTWRQLQGWITSLPLAFDAVGMKRVREA